LEASQPIGEERGIARARRDNHDHELRFQRTICTRSDIKDFTAPNSKYLP
jgi:hypothetical protein